jgi:hypothetical protein
MLANLFHGCMSKILAPIKIVGKTGVEMKSGDGVTRRAHPLFACFVGDYPEQVLACGCKTGECPKCDVPNDSLGDYPAVHPLRDLDKVLKALETLEAEPEKFIAACREAGVKPITRPFWMDLPYADIYLAITPDILHQLYQGVIKHIVAWIISAYGEKEIDARCRRLPPNHNIRIFSNGISSLSRVTGKEHADMCRIVLGLIIDLRLPGNYSPLRLICALRAILDFLYLSRYPVHTRETLACLDDALKRFHSNKNIFVDLGIRSGFNLPKLHSLSHYSYSIKMFGTTDNYNTEYTERLHIDLAKDAYRATNKKDEYAQMTVWLERKEKVLRHEKYIRWRLDPGGRRRTQNSSRSALLDTYLGDLQMAKWPSTRCSFDELSEAYGATFFREALARYIIRSTLPNLNTRNQVESAAADLDFGFNKVPVFHKIKFVDPNTRTTLDSIHAKPARSNKYGHTIASRFDTAFVDVDGGQELGIAGALILVSHLCYQH